MRFGLVAAGVGLASLGFAVVMGVGTVEAAPMSVAPLAAPVTTPATPLQPAVATGNEAKLILVRGGCGFGEHRGWYGRCRYNHGWRGRIRARHNWWRHHRW